METIKVNYITAIDILMERYKNVELFNNKSKALDFTLEDSDDAVHYGADLINLFLEPSKILAVGQYEGNKTEFYKPFFIYGDLRLFYLEHLGNYIKKQNGDIHCIYVDVFDFEAQRIRRIKNE